MENGFWLRSTLNPNTAKAGGAETEQGGTRASPCADSIESLKTVPTIKRKGLAAVTSSFFASVFAALGPYDVVHIHAEGPALFCWLPKLFGKRVVVTVHGAAVIIGTQFQGWDKQICRG